MPAILFSHPQISRNLTVETGANQISWAYVLNTATYPTYAGEVVQVLSTAIDELNIQGEVKNYAQMEEIYRWFLEYMQKATQGYQGDRYNEQAVKMEYPHRGWTLYIQPKSLPGLRYGRDVVIPTWEMQAHVLDPDPEQAELTIDAAINTELTDFRNRLTADIGFRQANPFSDPLGVLTEEEHKLFPDSKQRFEGQDAKQDLEGIAKRLSEIIGEYIQGKFGSLGDILETYGLTEASGPADPQKKDDDEPDQKDKG